MLPLTDGAIKLLSDRYPLVQLLWIRFFFPFWIIALIAWRRNGPRVFITGRTKLLVCRSLFLLGSSYCFYVAIKHIPLADASAIASSNPLILLVLLGIILRERIALRLWVAVLLGLMAVFIIIRPGFEGYNPASLYALATAFLAAGFMFINRLLRNSVAPLVTVLYQLFIASLVLTPVMPFVWVKPAPVDLLLVIAGSLGNVCGHLLVIRAFNFAEASLLAPFMYSSIITHIVMGYLLFGDLPDIWTWLGIALLVGVGIYVSLKDPALVSGSETPRLGGELGGP